jgi:ABC-type multidrug transport system permease subunit
MTPPIRVVLSTKKLGTCRVELSYVDDMTTKFSFSRSTINCYHDSLDMLYTFLFIFLLSMQINAEQNKNNFICKENIVCVVLPEPHNFNGAGAAFITLAIFFFIKLLYRVLYRICCRSHKCATTV